MKSTWFSRHFQATVFALGMTLASAVLADNHGVDPEIPSEILEARLATFDDLTCKVFASEDWHSLHRNHSDSVIVQWPDGQRTTGLDVHIEKLGEFFAFAPDMHLVGFTMKFGWSNWTAAMAVLQGTFTEPLETQDGRVIPPTGDRFLLPMSTIGYWDDSGVMIEEWLFWDTLSLLRQIGAE